MIHKSDRSAVILAGGKSSRMGSDKGLTDFNGKELITYPISLLKPIFKEVFIIANSPAYRKFKLPVYGDLVKNSGPLAGIYTGLMHSSTPWNYFIACDMPLVKKDIIYSLAESMDQYDAVVPLVHDRHEPMCAFYNKSAIPVIEKQLENGKNKIQDIFPFLKLKTVDFTHLISEDKNPFVNINTIDELRSHARS